MIFNLFVLVVSVGFIVSCKKENPTPETPNNPSPIGQPMTDFFKENVQNSKQIFTINSSIQQTITGSKGTKLTFYANSFETMSGQAVSGNVTIELVEIYTKKDMILMNKATVGKTFIGVAPLVSGGEFYVVAKQNGQTLRLKEGVSYFVQAPAVNGIENQMGLFYGEVDSSDQVTWEQADSAFVDSQGNDYYTYFDSLNWVNLDYFMNQSGPQTPVAAVLPSEYNPSNAVVFISVDGTSSIATLYAFVNNQYVSSAGYTLPVGLPVHFIALATVNGELHAAVVSSTISNGHVETFSNLNPVTESQLEALLDALP